MGYIRKTVHTGNTVEVEEYFTNRIGIHDRRAKKAKPSSAQAREAYIRRVKKKLRRLMNANFQDGRDALVTFSWAKSRDQPRNMQEVKEAAQALLRRLRREYDNIGLELKYIYCVEIGPHGSRHIHAVLSNAGEVPIMLLQKWWNGVVNVRPLHTEGQYEDLANYMIKSWAQKTEANTGEELSRCYETSKNLTKPEVEIERIRERDIRREIEEKPGLCLDRSSVREGVGEFTGRPYRFYRYHVLDHPEKEENCAGANEKPGIRQDIAKQVKRAGEQVKKTGEQVKKQVQEQAKQKLRPEAALRKAAKGLNRAADWLGERMERWRNSK
jgi:hypothetical protein